MMYDILELYNCMFDFLVNSCSLNRLNRVKNVEYATSSCETFFLCLFFLSFFLFFYSSAGRMCSSLWCLKELQCDDIPTPLNRRKCLLTFQKRQHVSRAERCDAISYVSGLHPVLKMSLANDTDPHRPFSQLAPCCHRWSLAALLLALERVQINALREGKGGKKTTPTPLVELHQGHWIQFFTPYNSMRIKASAKCQ